MLTRSLLFLARYAFDIQVSHAGLTPQAAAYKLGADYPAQLYENKFARLCMNLYLLMAHGKWLSKKRTSQF
jgi:hypothetical protein